MSGWSSAQIRIKHLGKKAEVVEQGKQASILFYDIESGVIDYSGNPAVNVLLVPRQMSEGEWMKYAASKAMKC